MKKLISLIAVAAVAVAAQAAFSAQNHGGDIVYVKPLKAVLFSHKIHVEDKGLTCDMCHDRLFGMQALKAQENSDFTMASLYEGKYCGACHNGTMAFASNTRCATCHIGVKGVEAKEGKGAKGHKAGH